MEKKNKKEGTTPTAKKTPYKIVLCVISNFFNFPLPPESPTWSFEFHYLVSKLAWLQKTPALTALHTLLKLLMTRLNHQQRQEHSRQQHYIPVKNVAADFHFREGLLRFAQGPELLLLISPGTHLQQGHQLYLGCLDTTPRQL